MKRKKAGLMNLINAGVEYHAYQRIKNYIHGYGWRLTLDKPLTAEQKKALEGFKNLSFGECHHKYAPEIRYNTITLFDKCKREV